MKTRRYTSKRDRAEILRRQNGRCARCPAPLLRGNYHIDHFIPVSAVLGGADDLANKQALCISCHRVKTALDVKAIKKVRHLTRPKRLSSTPFPGSRCTQWKFRLTAAGHKAVRRAA